MRWWEALHSQFNNTVIAPNHMEQTMVSVKHHEPLLIYGISYSRAPMALIKSFVSKSAYERYRSS